MREPKPREEAPVKIVCVQMEPLVGEKAKHAGRTLDLVREAAAHGAQLIVLPELCNSEYVLASRDEAFALAEEIPDGPTCRAWCDTARRLLAERCLRSLYGGATTELASQVQLCLPLPVLLANRV